MGNIAIAISILVPLVSAAISLIGIIYTEPNKRKRVKADLDIIEQLSKLDIEDTEYMIPDLKAQLSREVYSLLRADSSWKNLIWSILFLLASISLFVICGLLMFAAMSNNTASSTLPVVCGAVISLSIAIYLLLKCGNNLELYRSFKSYSKYLSGYINSLPEAIEYAKSRIEKAVSDSARFEKSSKEMTSLVDNISQSFRKDGVYPDDRLIPYPNKLLISLEDLKLFYTGLIEHMEGTIKFIETVDRMSKRSLSQLDYVRSRSLRKTKTKVDEKAVNDYRIDLSAKKAEAKSSIKTLERCLNGVKAAIERLNSAKNSGTFDDQVVIENPSTGKILLTDRKSSQEFDLMHFFDKYRDDFFNIRPSNVSDKTEIVSVKNKTDGSYRTIGFLMKRDDIL